MNDNVDRDKIRRALAQYLEGLQRAGVSVIPKANLASLASIEAPVSASPRPAAVARPLVPAPEAVPVVPRPVASPVVSAPKNPLPNSHLESEMPSKKPNSSAPPAKSVAPAAKVGAPLISTPLNLTGSSKRKVALEVINDEVKGCSKCPALVANRTQTVFGVGNVDTRLCFFGEAPGADEDRLGEPFVGRAGELLNKIIEAMTLRREEVFILNVLKCRPPGNRPPEEDEVANCRHFFERQLEILKPDFICCLGASAAKALLNTNFSIGKLRGRFYDYNGAQVIATYHPAYLLRNPGAKKDVWEDMKILMKAMGIEPQKPSK